MWIAAGGTLIFILALWLAVKVGYTAGKIISKGQDKEDYEKKISVSYIEGFNDGYNIGADKFYINMN